MIKNIFMSFLLIIGSINASESILNSSYNYNISDYDMQQIKQMSCNIFKLNWKIQDFVTENLKTGDNTIINDLQNLSINSTTFSLLIYDENFCNISIYINSIKNTLSNLLSKPNLKNNNKLEQINKDFLNICNILNNV